MAINKPVVMLVVCCNSIIYEDILYKYSNLFLYYNVFVCWHINIYVIFILITLK